MERYTKQTEQASLDQGPVQLTLRDLILDHLSEWIPQLVDAEIDDVLGRKRYEHHADQNNKQYRNGYHKERSLTSGMGTFPVRLRRLREPFESQIVGRYQRHTREIGEVLPQLYLHGLATGDFQDALHVLLGENAPLSGSTIVRLKRQWEDEYRQWKERRLQAEYLYVWADGVYPKAGPRAESLAVLVVVGLNRKGEKELLAIEEGFRESYQSWRDVLRDIRKRGVRWVGLMIADGLEGLRKAMRDVFPLSRQQRCFLHKMRNVLDKVPAKLHDEVLQALQEMYNAKSREQALTLKRAFIARYEKPYPEAVRSLNEAGDQLFTYFDFPKSHWRSIKSTNVVESMFNAVKLRTDAARRIPSRKSALFLVFKLLTTQEQRLHKIHGYKLVPETIDTIKHAQRTLLRKAA
ncbi:MAG: IS256 family transposase [Candidatus Eisenbacteria bacterium]|nr:IS256 family transposase [Candidatus Eisenbacteria bacterium]